MITYYVVNACEHTPNESCSGCVSVRNELIDMPVIHHRTKEIMDYAEVDRLPVVLFFKKRVLKAEVIGGFEPSVSLHFP
jgi:hypothetical protein